jgi:hypothetical protein
MPKPQNHTEKKWLTKVTYTDVQLRESKAIREWQRNALTKQNEINIDPYMFTDPNITVNREVIEIQEGGFFRKEITLDDCLDKLLFGKKPPSAKIRKQVKSSEGNKIMKDLVWREIRKTVVIELNQERRPLGVSDLKYFTYQMEWTHNPNNPAHPTAKVTLDVFLFNDGKDNYYLLSSRQNQDQDTDDTIVMKHDQTNKLPKVKDLALLLRVEVVIAARKVNSASGARLDMSISSPSSFSSTSSFASSLSSHVSLSSFSSFSSFSALADQSSVAEGLVVDSMTMSSNVANISIVPSQIEKEIEERVKKRNLQREKQAVEQLICSRISEDVQIQIGNFRRVEVTVHQAVVSETKHDPAVSTMEFSGSVSVFKYIRNDEDNFLYAKQEGASFPPVYSVAHAPKLPKELPRSNVPEPLLTFVAVVSYSEIERSQSSEVTRISSLGLPITKNFKVESIRMEKKFDVVSIIEGQNTKAYKEEQERLEEERAAKLKAEQAHDNVDENNQLVVGTPLQRISGVISGVFNREPENNDHRPRRIWGLQGQSTTATTSDHRNDNDDFRLPHGTQLLTNDPNTVFSQPPENEPKAGCFSCCGAFFSASAPQRLIANNSTSPDIAELIDKKLYGVWGSSR